MDSLLSFGIKRVLVLSRKKNQSIIVGNDIEIMVVDVTYDQVKLGIKAPRDISVHRKEVYENVKKEMKVALNSEIPKITPHTIKKPSVRSFKKDESFHS